MKSGKKKKCFKGSLTDDGTVLKVCSRACSFTVKEQWKKIH